MSSIDEIRFCFLLLDFCLVFTLHFEIHKFQPQICNLRWYIREHCFVEFHDSQWLQQENNILLCVHQYNHKTYTILHTTKGNCHFERCKTNACVVCRILGMDICQQTERLQNELRIIDTQSR